MKNEGKTTSLVEMETRKIPSISFLGAAFVSMAISAGLLAAGKKSLSMFVGQWVPTILLLGTYNKITKTFSAPYNEDQRLHHGGHAVDKPNESDLQPAYR